MFIKVAILIGSVMWHDESKSWTNVTKKRLRQEDQKKRGKRHYSPLFHEEYEIGTSSRAKDQNWMWWTKIRYLETPYLQLHLKLPNLFQFQLGNRPVAVDTSICKNCNMTFCMLRNLRKKQMCCDLVLRQPDPRHPLHDTIEPKNLVSLQLPSGKRLFCHILFLLEGSTGQLFSLSSTLVNCYGTRIINYPPWH